jgi:4-amino-4-deoxy-L-arabinose transferase-like glycosyltransferase
LIKALLQTHKLRSCFWLALVATLLIRLALAQWLPITGDEAYFVQWGHFPDYGFYDHPPMVGWWLWALLHWSSAPEVLRLPQILLPGAIAIAMWRVMRKENEQRAYLAALAWLLVPPQVLNIAITTDTPLLLFSFLSLTSFYLGVRDNRRGFIALAGIFLGLAFLCKYFAVLLGLAYFVFALLSPRRERRWIEIALIFVLVLPFAAINIAWNYEHCWANIMFNVYNRNSDAAWSLSKPLLFIALLLFVTTPLLWFQLARRARLRQTLQDEPALLALWVCALVPLAVFALLSPIKNIGLHWLLSFVPALFMAASHLLDARQLARNVVYVGALSLALLLTVVAIATQPIERWRDLKIYDGLIQTFKTDELFAALKPYEGRYLMMAAGYSPAVTMSYNAQREGFVAQPGANGARAGYFSVFGTGSSHARHDDVLTDFSALDGRDILIVTKKAPRRSDYAPYFSHIDMREASVRGVRFHLVVGQHFDFARYRAEVLSEIRERYYRVPAYLPQGHCYFCERYFDGPICSAQ